MERGSIRPCAGRPSIGIYWPPAGKAPPTLVPRDIVLIEQRFLHRSDPVEISGWKCRKCKVVTGKYPNQPVGGGRIQYLAIG